MLYGVNTRLVKGRDTIRAADIQMGDMIFAAGNVDAKKKTVGAAILIDIPAEEVRKAREGLGKTWAAGKIRAIEGTKIQVHRLDGVEQKIAVDESTSFREKHDSVTLADLRPGEGFRAEGHVMNGTFTATTLTVFDLKGHEPWLDAGSEAVDEARLHHYCCAGGGSAAVRAGARFRLFPRSNSYSRRRPFSRWSRSPALQTCRLRRTRCWRNHRRA